MSRRHDGKKPAPTLAKRTTDAIVRRLGGQHEGAVYAIVATTFTFGVPLACGLIWTMLPKPMPAIKAALALTALIFWIDGMTSVARRPEMPPMRNARDERGASDANDHDM